MTMVWLLWESQSLREVFAAPEDANVAAAALRATLRARDRNSYTGHVRIDRWTVSPADPRPPGSGRRVLDWIEEMAVKWPLLTLAEMGTGHFFEIEHYLAVVHGGVLKFPQFQFQPDRTQWPGFREALTIFRDGDWDEASIALWFTGAQAVTNGQPPALVVQYEPDTVIAAARKLTALAHARSSRAVTTSPARTGFGPYAGEPDDLSVDDAAIYLGLTAADVHRLIEADELYAFLVGVHLHVPAWQFTNNTTLPHLSEVVETLAPLQLHPMTVAGFMTTPSDELDGTTPVQWLAEGGPMGPVQFAATALTAW